MKRIDVGLLDLFDIPNFSDCISLEKEGIIIKSKIIEELRLPKSTTLQEFVKSLKLKETINFAEYCIVSWKEFNIVLDEVENSIYRHIRKRREIGPFRGRKHSGKTKLQMSEKRRKYWQRRRGQKMYNII